MGRPSNIPPEQRTELVLAVVRGTEKLEVLARRHQVSANTLRKWRDEFVAAGQERLSGRGDTATAQAECKQLQRELAERELIIGELTVAQRFLQKKWTAPMGRWPATRTESGRGGEFSMPAAHQGARRLGRSGDVV